MTALAASVPSWFPHYWLVYVPLGIIGLMRWSTWLARKTPSFFYRPIPPLVELRAVSVITPVYNEDPDSFRRAVGTWIAERPTEIIAVIDASDERCISVFNEISAASPVEMRLLVTTAPGKRQALVDGIRAAKTDIVALVDSDTLWDPGLLPHVLAPFANPKVGGVGTRQNVLNARNLWQRVADIVLDLRYHDEMRFLARAGGQVTCLSGRTAIYRRAALMPLLDEFIEEYFLGEQCFSGDDKRFTYLIQEQGWHSAYQHAARVYTFAPSDFSTFIKQRVRWARNSWRADLRALGQRWTWSHPIFALFLIDRCISPFTGLLAPIFMAYALIHAHWIIAGVLAAWWLVSRSIKILPHVLNRPVDILLVPLYVPITFLLALVKVHALVTVGWQGWLTRSAAQKPQFSRAATTAASVLATGGVVALMISLVFLYSAKTLDQKQSFGSNDKFVVVAADLPPPLDVQAMEDTMYLPGSILGLQPVEEQLAERLHVMAPEEDARSLAFSAYGSTVFERVIRYANTDDNLRTGGSVVLPRVGSPPARPRGTGNASVAVNLSDKTIIVSGPGSVSTLSSIAHDLPAGLLTQVRPGEWLLSAPLVIQNGASLSLIGTAAGGDTNWLMLKSTADSAVSVAAIDANIYLESTRVTSWDPAAGSFDQDDTHSRAFVLAKSSSPLYQARMDIVDSELAYLGYDSPESYGVTWRVSADPSNAARSVTGTVLGTRFHDNYIGAYTSGAVDMFWAGNELFDNTAYGLNLHKGSDKFVISYNRIHNNRQRGLVLSAGSDSNVVVHNAVSDNGLEGIGVAGASAGNWLLRNEIHNNLDGVVVHGSSGNAVVQNAVQSNRHTGIHLDANDNGPLAALNLVAFNTVRANQRHGIVASEFAVKNTIQGNRVDDHPGDGILILSSQNRVGGPAFLGNVLHQDRKGIVIAGDAARQNLIEGNEVVGSAVWGITLAGGEGDLVFRNVVRDGAQAGISIHGTVATRLVSNNLVGNALGVKVSACDDCRMIANDGATPADLAIKVERRSNLLVEDQAHAEIALGDTTSTVTVADRSGNVVSLPRHEPVFNVDGRTSVQIRALQPGVRVQFERSNLQLSANTLVAVRLQDLQAMTWTIAGGGGVSNRISGLEHGRSYEVRVDGTPLEQVRADESGAVAFQYDGDLSEPKTFELRLVRSG